MPEGHTDGVASAYWNSFSDPWRYVRPPLRPDASDVAAVRRVALRRADELSGNRMRTLLLGVTPEIANLDWPTGTELRAIDRSPEMIARHWSGDRPGRTAACLDWFQGVPLHGPWDFMVADGSLNCLRDTGRVKALIELLQHHSQRGALLVARCFVEPEPRQPPEAVFRNLRMGNYDSFHIFKFHLAMSLQSAAGSGVRLADVWERWSAEAIAVEELHQTAGWPIAEIRTIDVHRGSENRLWFPTLAQMRALLEERFHLEELTIPEYAMGERCPRFVLRCL
jgi:hypothetical protein